jgi:hypothetical protein
LDDCDKVVVTKGLMLPVDDATDGALLDANGRIAAQE